MINSTDKQEFEAYLVTLSDYQVYHCYHRENDAGQHDGAEDRLEYAALAQIEAEKRNINLD